MCGIAGVKGIEKASELVEYMLISQQHRGQAGAGIISMDKKGTHTIKGLGLVEHVMHKKKLTKVTPGPLSLGHVRYATTGDAKQHINIQPFTARLWLGEVALAHNGNLTNYKQLRRKLEGEGSIFSTTSDTEVILHLLQKANVQHEQDDLPMDRDHKLISAISEVCKQIRGAFSLVFITDQNEMILVTDPYNIRPLVMARYGDGWVVASENCAFSELETSQMQDLPPGSITIIKPNNQITQAHYSKKMYTRHCIFELIYFAHPVSSPFGVSTYEARQRMAQLLAKVELPHPIDTVIAVPDSSNIATIAYGEATNIHRGYGFVRNHYTGRSFIATSEQRKRLLDIKFKVNRKAVAGKRVGVVDDSLVRGSTAKKIIERLRKAGALEVHLLIVSPPIVYPCDLGINTPTREELIAATTPREEIAKTIGANSVTYLPFEKLREAVDDQDGIRFCTTCFTGTPPSPEIGEDQEKLRAFSA